MEMSVSTENGIEDEITVTSHSHKSKLKEANCRIVNGEEINTKYSSNSQVEVEYNARPVELEKNGSLLSETSLNVEDITCELQNLDVQIPSTSGIISNVNGKKLKRVKVELETSEEDEDLPQCETIVSEKNCDISIARNRPTSLSFHKPKRHVLKISPNEISNPDSPLSENGDKLCSPETDSQDDIENSIIEILNSEGTPEKIPELTLAEERSESRRWKVCTIAGVKRQIDMKVIEPYKRVLSHGGYMNTGCHNAIITFSACFLPHKSRVDYNYVMDNLFFYILYTLNQLITDDYVLVYLHGGTSKDCIPKFSWLKRCYRMIDRKLKKNLKAVYLVHTTFWLKTLVTMIKPFISSKFSRKMHFVDSLAELNDILPIEEASIPDKVKQYDRIKSSFSLRDK